MVTIEDPFVHTWAVLSLFNYWKVITHPKLFETEISLNIFAMYQQQIHEITLKRYAFVNHDALDHVQKFNMYQYLVKL